MTKSNTIGTIIVIVVLAIAVLYILNKLGKLKLPSLGDLGKQIQINLQEGLAAIESALKGGEKNLQSFGKQFEDKNLLALGLTDHATSKGGGSVNDNGISDFRQNIPTTRKTTITTNTKTEGAIDPNTGELKITKPKQVTINLKETVNISESQANAIAAAKIQNSNPEEQLANLKQYQIKQTDTQLKSIPLSKAVSSGKIISPLKQTPNIFETFIKDLESLTAFGGTQVETPTPKIIDPLGIA